MDFVLLFITSMITFLAVDLIWLGWVAKDIYAKLLKNKLRKPPNWPAALIFYSLFVIGLIYFAIWPAVNDDSLLKAMVSGGLFGFMTYATYDLTNYATLKNWPLKLVFIDIAWGTVLSFTVAVVNYNVYIGLIDA